MEKYYGMNIRKRLQNPYLIFVLGCLLGSLVFVCIYGLAVVNVTMCVADGLLTGRRAMGF